MFISGVTTCTNDIEFGAVYIFYQRLIFSSVHKLVSLWSTGSHSQSSLLLIACLSNACSTLHVVLLSRANQSQSWLCYLLCTQTYLPLCSNVHGMEISWSAVIWMGGLGPSRSAVPCAAAPSTLPWLWPCLHPGATDLNISNRSHFELHRSLHVWCKKWIHYFSRIGFVPVLKKQSANYPLIWVRQEKHF